ncbi:MAG: hypothetical protein AB7Q37_07210 [Pyrinomonadaceae bacterium]
MTIEELVNGIPNFGSWTDADRIRLFAWYLHSKRANERFTSTEIKGCYQALGLQQPSSISPFLKAMESRVPKQLLKDKRGYHLEKRIRDEYEKRYGLRPAAIHVDKYLTDLPAKVPNLIERDFLNETITCYRAKAFRASIVMAWNLAYDHLCRYVLANKLAQFNTQYPLSYPKVHAGSKMKAVTTFDDFAELKESQVVQICRSANIISNDVFKILNEKLGTRNSYAHPSSLMIVPHTAEEVILNLVNNVVLKYG